MYIGNWRCKDRVFSREDQIKGQKYFSADNIAKFYLFSKKGPIFATSKTNINKNGIEEILQKLNKNIMKKMMKMAFVAVMGMMMMSANTAKAVSVAPVDPAEMAMMEDRTSISERLESRTMIHCKGDETNKFVYLIGEDGVVKSKTHYRLNNDTNEWMPICCYRAIYGAETNTVVCARWNKNTNAYDANVTSATYDKEECPLLIKLPNVIDY